MNCQERNDVGPAKKFALLKSNMSVCLRWKAPLLLTAHRSAKEVKTVWSCHGGTAVLVRPSNESIRTDFALTGSRSTSTCYYRLEGASKLCGKASPGVLKKATMQYMNEGLNRLLPRRHASTQQTMPSSSPSSSTDMTSRLTPFDNPGEVGLVMKELFQVYLFAPYLFFTFDWLHTTKTVGVRCQNFTGEKVTFSVPPDLLNAIHNCPQITAPEKTGGLLWMTGISMDSWGLGSCRC